MKRLVVHIGLHKTGTSYLQNILLPNLVNTRVVRGWLSHRDIMSIDADVQLIISDESISGNPFHGNYLQEFEANVRKLKRLYGNPKIIFGIRHQARFLLSLYKQSLHEGGKGTIEELYNTENTGLIKHHELSLVNKINILRSNFSDIFVYSQETLRVRPEDFTKALCIFLGTEIPSNLVSLGAKSANVGLKTTAQANMLRRLNKMNHKFKESRFLPDLYGKWFRKLGLTPNAIILKYGGTIGKKQLSLDDSLENHLINYYKEDWEMAQKFLSY